MSITSSEGIHYTDEKLKNIYDMHSKTCDLYETNENAFAIFRGNKYPEKIYDINTHARAIPISENKGISFDVGSQIFSIISDAIKEGFGSTDNLAVTFFFIHRNSTSLSYYEIAILLQYDIIYEIFIDSGDELIHLLKTLDVRSLKSKELFNVMYKLDKIYELCVKEYRNEFDNILLNKELSIKEKTIESNRAMNKITKKILEELSIETGIFLKFSTLEKNIILHNDKVNYVGYPIDDKAIYIYDITREELSPYMTNQININKPWTSILEEILNKRKANTKNLLIDRLTVKNENKYLFDIEFNSNANQSRFSPFTTVLIGENGAGKSRVLATLCELLTSLFDYVETGRNLKMENDYYCLKFRINNVNSKIVIENNKIRNFTDFSKVDLPNKLLAVSYLLNDKFRFQSSENEHYTYLGVKNTVNTASTNSIDRNINISLLKLLINIDNYVVHELLRGLNLDNIIRFNIEINRENVVNIDAHELDKIEEFLIDNPFLDIIPLFNCPEEKLYNMIKWYNINYINLKLFLSKQNQKFNFVEGSSGEKQLLYTFLSIASNIKDGALVLIDEPEISLHPVMK